jgi:hypothetical protein
MMKLEKHTVLSTNKTLNIQKLQINGFQGMYSQHFIFYNLQIGQTS